MGFQPFNVHYEQRTPTTNGKDVTFNITPTTINVPSNFRLNDLRIDLARVSVPAARRAYNNHPDHQTGFYDSEHEGKWKFHFEDQFGNQERNENGLVDHYLDEDGFGILVKHMGAFNPKWRVARVWHERQRQYEEVEKASAEVEAKRATTPDAISFSQPPYVSSRRLSPGCKHQIYKLLTDEGAVDLASNEDRRRYKKEIDEFNERRQNKQ